ncbi:MAG TPA: thiolase family protein [Chloroflexota bacterium]
MEEAVILSAVRTPVGRRNGQLADVHPVNLLAEVLCEAVRRAGIEPRQVEDVIVGCVSQVGEQAFNVGRNAVLAAGFPVEVPATTLDRQCASSEQAVHFVASQVQSGACDIAVGAGVESMTRVPMFSSRAGGNPFPPELLARYELVDQGLSAELIAERWGISRQEADEFALESHRRAVRAVAEGRFDDEILPVDDHGRDEGPRPDTSLEKLATLKPSFKEDGILTAGNSSQISDGAAAVVVASRSKARELGLKARARIAGQRVVGVDPVIMLTGPIPATQQLLERHRLRLSDVDLVEINEAFAPVVLAWQRELQPTMERVNVNGGAIALGHPLGATGARLMTTLLHEMERRDVRFGLQTMCCGGGIGVATLLDREV